jgi:hypothetical protein
LLGDETAKKIRSHPVFEFQPKKGSFFIAKDIAEKNALLPV